LEFKIATSINLNTSTFLFDQIGNIITKTNKAGNSQQVRVIDSLIKVTGMKTGYSINVPLRFAKSIA